MNPEEDILDPRRPVAYDAEGQPLYAAPQMPEENPLEVRSHVTNAPTEIPGHNFDPGLRAQYANEPGVVHKARAYEPSVSEISDELRQKHLSSQSDYPNLNLSEGEYVIIDIKRHPIGLFIPVASTITLIALMTVAMVGYPLVVEADPATGEIPGYGLALLALICLTILVGIGGYIAVWVYLRNTFFLTNESVVQEIQHSIFSKHEQTVSLGSIEDASFKQYGILPSLLNYGTIRLSTEGEETTYSFQYVADPKNQIAIVNNAIESFKNGRPVGDD